MQVSEFEHKHTFGEWVADWSRTGDCDYSDQNAVLRMHRPVLQLNFRHTLNEINYRGLMSSIDPNFLSQGIRVGRNELNNAYQLPNSGVVYHFGGVSYQRFYNNTMVFYVTPSTEFQERHKDPYYVNQIKFMEWDDICSDANMTPQEKATMLLWTSDLQLHCTDPSFKWWGYQYILTQLNAAVQPNSIYPKTNNAQLQGIVCKHLNRILHVLPFYLSDIARAVTEQWGGKIDKKAIDAIRKRADAQRQANANVDLPPEPEDVTGPPPEVEIPPQDQDQELPPPENPDDETPPTF